MTGMQLEPGQRTVVRRKKVAVAAADAVAILASDFAAVTLFPTLSANILPNYIWRALLVFLPLRLMILSSQGLYGSRNVAHHVEEIRRLLNATALGVFLMVLAEFFFRLVIPRGFVLLSAVITLVFLAIEREFVRYFFRRARRRGKSLRSVVLIGVGDGSRDVMMAIRNEPWSGSKVLGFYADTPVPDVEASNLSLDYLGSVGHAIAHGLPTGCTGIIVDPSKLTGTVLNNVLRHFNYDGYFVEVVAPMRGIAPERLKAVPLGRLTTIRVNEPGNTAVRTVAKRIVDLVIGSVAMLIFAPVWAMCAIAIKIDSKGPIFFRQERVGLSRKNFGCFKFRTMVADAEKQRDLMRDAGADGMLFKMEKDPRITKVGAFLRKTSLDETPQLLNVLVGQMSLVGPRPLPAKDLLGKSDERIGDRLRVRPGMTGMWQVSGRSDVTDDDFLTLDLYYVDNWSLFVDLLIIGKTIPAVLFAKGAY